MRALQSRKQFMQNPPGTGRSVAVLCLILCLAGCGRHEPVAQIESARKALADKDLDTALVTLKSVLQDNPSLGEARLLLAEALFQKEDWTGSAAELDKAAALGIPANRLLLPRARVLLAQGKVRQLIADYESERLDDNAGQADLQVLLASAHLSQGRTERADQALAEALRQSPKHLEAHLLHIQMRMNQGQDSDLLQRIDGVLSEHPESADGYMLKYRLRVTAGAPADERVAILKSALKAAPKHASAQAALVEHLLRVGQLDEARTQLSLFTRTHPRDLRARMLDAALTLRQNKPQKALAMARELAKLAPDHTAALTLAGVISFETGDLLQAEASLAKALAQSPDATAVRNLLARAQLGRGDSEQALKTVSARIGSREPQADLLAVAGAAYLIRGELGKAEEALSASLREGKGQKAVRMSLAMLKLKDSRSDEGLADLSQLASEETGDNTALLILINTQLRSGKIDAALKSIDVLSGRDPKNPMGPFLRGRLELARKAPPAARDAFAEALGRDDKHFPSIAALNALDLSQGKGGAQARIRLQKLISVEARHIKARLALIRLDSLESGDAQRAREQYAALVKDAPTDVEAQIAQVRFFMDIDNYPQALIAAQAAAAALPNEPQVLDALGRAQILVGDDNQALSTYGRWASAQPRSTTPLLRIADVQIQRKNYDAADAAIARALALQPNHLEAQQARLRLELIRGRFDVAQRIARRVQAWPAHRAVGIVLEGDIHAARRQWPVALQAYQRAQAVDGNSSGIAIKVHQMHTMAGNTVEADRHAEKWLSANPDSVEFHLYVGNTAATAGRLEKAELHFERAHTLAPEQALIANNLAWLRTELKRDNALAMAQLASRLQPHNAKVMDTLAGAHAQQGDLNAALKAQRTAIEISPKDDTLRLHLVELLLSAKLKTEAKREADKLHTDQLNDVDRKKLSGLKGLLS